MTDSDVYGKVDAEQGRASPADGSPADESPTGADSTAADSTAAESKSSRMPLAASVLLADVGIAIVALVLLIVIGLQRWDDTSLSAQHRAYAESLVLIFLVAALFGVVGVLLLRAKHVKVAIMQFVVTAAVLVLVVVVAANGNPKPDTSDNQAAASISTVR